MRLTMTAKDNISLTMIQGGLGYVMFQSPARGSVHHRSRRHAWSWPAHLLVIPGRSFTERTQAGLLCRFHVPVYSFPPFYPGCYPHPVAYRLEALRHSNSPALVRPGTRKPP